MSSVFGLAANGLFLPNRKPLGPVRLDFSQPITQGLFDCLLFNEGAGAPINYAIGAPQYATLTSNPTWAMTAAGPGGMTTGGSSFNIPYHGSLVGGDFSIRLLVYVVSWPANFTTLFDKSSGVSREAALFFDTSGNIDFMDFGGLSGSVSVATGMSAPGLYDFVMTRAAGVTSAYVNGKFISTFGSSATTGVAGSVLSLGGNPSGGGSFANVSYISAQTWLRAISADEISNLYINPYHFVTPSEGEMPALVAPAPGSSVLNADGIGSTSFVAAGQGITVLNAAGVASTSFVAKAVGNAVLNADGVAATSFVARGQAKSVLNADGVASTNFVGAGKAIAVLNADGIATTSYVGRSAVIAALNAAGISSVNFLSATGSVAILNAAGVASVNFLVTLVPNAIGSRLITKDGARFSLSQSLTLSGASLKLTDTATKS